MKAVRPFSLFWEARTLLSLGILSLASGSGILIYKHIDTIGHQTILALMALATLACFRYAMAKAEPFTPARSKAESPWPGYALLLGVLLFGSLVGYLQARYSVFGRRHAAAFAVPAALYLYLAYRYDHRGVLQLAISGGCAAVGLAATPFDALREGLFEPHTPIRTALAMAAVLAAAAAFSERRDCKRHFAFSYANFAMHLSLIAAIWGMVLGGPWGKCLFFLLAASLAWALWKYAQWKRSYYFLLGAVLYGYIAFTYISMKALYAAGPAAGVSAAFAYFMLSCAGVILFFVNMKSFLGKAHADIPEK